MEVKEGDFGLLAKSFSKEDILKFGEAIGDTQTRSTLWKGDIVYGIATTALFSTVIRQTMPGAIYMNQEVKFLKPLFIDQEVEVRLEISSINVEKRNLQFLT